MTRTLALFCFISGGVVLTSAFAPVTLSHVSYTSCQRSQTSLVQIAQERSARTVLHQFFAGDDDETPKLTRELDSKQGAFQTNLDKATTTEKFKDPLVIIFLAWILGIGVIATVTILSSLE